MAATTGAVVLLGVHDQSPVVDALQKRNAILKTLYGTSKEDTDARVKMYVKERSALDVYPTIAGTVCKYTGMGGLGGLALGAFAGAGNPAVMGAGGAFGAVVGCVYGCHVAYKEQQYVYQDWLKKAANQKVNNEVIAIVRGIIRDRVNSMAKDYADLMDPINDNFMQRPVIDPTNGMVFDFTQHHKWIAENGRSYWTNVPLKVTELKVCYATCGRMHRLYSIILTEELNGAQLSSEQRKCVTLLLADLKRDIRYYYYEARAYIDKLERTGKIDPNEYNDRLSIITKMLYPKPAANNAVQNVQAVAPASWITVPATKSLLTTASATAAATAAKSSPHSSLHITPTSSMLQMLKESPPPSPKLAIPASLANSAPSLPSLSGSTVLVTPPVTPKTNK